MQSGLPCCKDSTSAVTSPLTSAGLELLHSGSRQTQVTSQGSHFGNEQVSFPSGLLLLWQSDHLLLILFGDTRANTHHLSALRQTAREKWRAALLLPPDCNDKEPARQCLQTDSHPPRGTAAAKLIASRTHAAERTLWYGQATGKRDLNAQLWEFNSAWSFSVLFFAICRHK